MFDGLKQTMNRNDCLHIHQNVLFIFSLSSILNYIERFNSANNHRLIGILRQQIDASNQPQFWNNTHVNTHIENLH